MAWWYYSVCFIFINQLTAQIVLIDGPKDQAIVFGQDLFLNCSVLNLTSGDRYGLKTMWTLNKVPISQRASMFSNGTLLVPMVTEHDLGNYTCRVYDSSDIKVLESSTAKVFHAFIKMFEVSPVPVHALEEELVSFDCITGESAPPPEIFWERNGVRFTEGEQYSATYGGYNENSVVIQYSMKLILRAKPSLDGAFNCVARNPVLKIDVRSLRVLMQTAELELAPYIIVDRYVPSVIAPLHQPMLLVCPVAGKPQVEVTWFKDGVSLAGSPGFFVLINGSLHRTQTELSDKGLYTCEGKNRLGFIRSPNISLTVARIDLDFVEEPQDTYVIAGLPATLKCSPPVSVPTATVTWYKDNALLVPRTGAQSLQVVKTVEGNWNIVFKEVQKIDEGEYFCVATNVYTVPQSRTSKSAVIRVGGAPIFVEPPVGLTIEKGKLAKLTCYVQGDPFPEVTWVFETTVLTVSETVSFRQGNQELWIGNINKGNEGTYTCRAVNRYGSIQTKVYVKVLVPPVVLQPVGHTISSMGDSVVIPCGIYSDPDPTITWYKDSAGITLGGRFTKLHDGLYITSVQVEDSGTYTCQAANMAGTTENTGTLEVLVKPQLVELPRDEVVNLGRNVTLTCSAKGYPLPVLRWTFNDTDLFPPNSLLSLDKQQLLLREVGWRHVGKYTCIAENKEGTAQASGILSLRVPPKISEIEGIPLLYQGEHLQLKCHVTGIPFPSIEWQFNRKPVVETINRRISIPDPTVLIVQYVTEQDAGTYTCKVMNPAGVSQRELDVYVISRPSPPVLYKAETVSATSVKLSWSIQQQQSQTPVDTVQISYRRKIDSTSPFKQINLDAVELQHLVSDLDPATEYVFMISARNGAGTSDMSNVLSAMTLDAGPSSPRNLVVLDVKANNITIGWEIPETTNGDVRKYQINYQEKGVNIESVVVISSNNEASHDYTIRDLKPYTWYTVEVRGATMEGDEVLWGNWSTSLEVKTSQAAPTGKAREVKAVVISTGMIQVTWEAVAQQQQNGPIKRYYVRFWLLSNTSSPVGEKIVDSLDLQVNISDLEPWTWYMVKVIPENAGGLGEASEPVNIRTLPAAPSGAPQNVSVEAPSATSMLVRWKLPPLEDLNSDLTGFVVEFWRKGTTELSRIMSVGLIDLSMIIRDLIPYTNYEVRVAAYTDQVTDGVGPFSDNFTVKTLQSEPGPVTKITFSVTPTSLKLSWRPPDVKNGIIQEYYVTYFLIGSAAVTTPIPDITQPIMSEHIQMLLNISDVKESIFRNFPEELSQSVLLPLAKICDIILENDTLLQEFENETDLVQLENVINIDNIWDHRIFDWLSSEHLTFGSICKDLQAVLVDALKSNTATEEVIYEILNVTTTKTTVTLTDLKSECMYNITVAAATIAGLGPPVHIQAATLKTPPTPTTTQQPIITTQRPTQQPPLKQSADDTEPLNLPVIIGGGVSGFVLLLIILVVGGCLCCRRAQSEEKAKVISHEHDDNANSMYGELDRPVHVPGMAVAAEDGTDSVDIYSEEVRFRSPKHHRDQGTARSFMTEESGHLGNSNRRSVRDLYLGTENPSYAGLAAPNSMKTNPAYYEESSSSNVESMSVTMAFSSEDNLTQTDESTLKRKHKMKSADAAAIARLRNSALPQGLSDTDQSSLIHNEVEVVYNERTAL